MIVSKITDIVRTSDLVYYMDEFQANAICNILGNEQQTKIEFRVENTATGKKHITVRLLDEIDYPTLPLQIELKKMINDLVVNEQLPL